MSRLPAPSRASPDGDTKAVGTTSADQYINLRPVKLYPNVETPLKDKGPEHIDFVVVRENTGGIYTGIGGPHPQGHPAGIHRPGDDLLAPKVAWGAAELRSARTIAGRHGNPARVSI